MSTHRGLGDPSARSACHRYGLAAFRRLFTRSAFAVDIATNSHDVLEAAAESLEPLPARTSTFDPIRFASWSQPEGNLSEPPLHRTPGTSLRGRLRSRTTSRASICSAARRMMFRFPRRPQPTTTWLRWFCVESLAYLLLAQRYLVPVHAACVERNGTGVLLCGAAGAGKSTLTFACARAGWTCVTDDCTWLLPDSTERDRHRPPLAGAIPPGCSFAVSRAGRSHRCGRAQRQNLASRCRSARFPESARPRGRRSDALVFLERGPARSRGWRR